LVNVDNNSLQSVKSLQDLSKIIHSSIFRNLEQAEESLREESFTGLRLFKGGLVDGNRLSLLGDLRSAVSSEVNLQVPEGLNSRDDIEIVSRIAISEAGNNGVNSVEVNGAVLISESRLSGEGNFGVTEVINSLDDGVQGVVVNL